MKKRFVLLIILFLVLFISVLTAMSISNKVDIKDCLTEHIKIEDPEQTENKLDIDFAFGDLSLIGDSKHLLEADFIYSLEELKPVVENEDGRISLSHTDTQIKSVDDCRSDWNLSINKELPTI